MIAPKEIYVPLVDMGVEDGSIQSAPIWWNKDKSMEKQDCKGAVKYIRADLAELTCEDIESIFRIADNYDSEFYRAKYLSKGYCKEILQRFLKSKTQQGCSPY